MDYQPGLLENVPNIIITEGKNDYYTLTYLNDVILGQKYKKVNLMPGAGCAKNSVVIQLYTAWGRNYMILLDGDKAGAKSRNEYISMFGELVQEHIRLYNDFVPEIGSVMMEDIFSEEEKLTITKRFNPSATSFNKSAFNTAIQEALIKRERIELSEDTISRFDQLLDGLEQYAF